MVSKPELKTGEDGFLDEVYSVPGGECVRWCVQCGMCAGSCPNVAWMEHSPRKMIALIRAGKRQEVLTSNSMWVCASCYLCTVRCPRGVEVTELMHVLDSLAARHGLANGKTRTPAMHRAFIENIKSNGRVHELGLMRRFFLRTNPLAAIKMMPVGLRLLLHGRLRLRPEKVRGAEQLRTIVERAQILGGAE
jgi:heterodisulfide reductase subunit C